MKTILAIALCIVIGTGVALLVIPRVRMPDIAELPVEEVSFSQSQKLCFASYAPVVSTGMQDVYTLTMTLAGTEVSGELELFPAEKDSKVGAYTGTVTAVDRMSMSRTIHAWWDTHAEGMQTTEELNIIFGEGTASIGMGAMKDRGDGVYVYDDATQLSYDLSLTDIGCDELTERENVSQYLREHIATLATEQPVLGGTWYVTLYTIDALTNTGVVTYEDGHIQHTSNFSYTTDSAMGVADLVFHTTR